MMEEGRDDSFQRLRAWEFEINNLYPHLPYVHVRNNFDDEGPPNNFKYIIDYVSNFVSFDHDDPIVGCECTTICSLKNSKNCCPAMAACKFAYDRNGLLILQPGNAIYECNNRCSCGDKCWNRVVQKGPTARFEIFKTNNNCGWGLRTLDNIKKGQFVLEYTGEIIDKDEVIRREALHSDGECSYLFNLDFNDKNAPYTVDATYYGNASRFINHSCSPNLEVYPVWINNLDPDLPRLAIFALRNIQKGEELSFDYKMWKVAKQKKKKRTSLKDNGRTPCLCGAKECRGYLN